MKNKIYLRDAMRFDDGQDVTSTSYMLLKTNGCHRNDNKL